MNRRLWTPLLLTLPWFIVLWVWLSPLAFVPVPWPDDSAFYFVGKDFFSWPPRWVMIPQAPFEPTYAEFNFNTMPLFPILVGMGRLIGIDGSFGIKLWPLSFFALSGTLLAFGLLRAKLHPLFVALITLTFMLDPVARWASVLLRPESLIGLCGVALVLGITLGFPKWARPRKYFDPVSALLAIAAYAHFNAIHLVFPVFIYCLREPRRFWTITRNTLLYLAPWFVMIAFHPLLFITQMKTQFTRLSVPNGWLKSPSEAISNLLHSMGSPEPWIPALQWGGALLWVLLFLAFFILILYSTKPILRFVSHHFFEDESLIPPHSSPDLFVPAGWVLGAVWLWHTKPEVWFIYYIHLSLFTFSGCLLLRHYRMFQGARHHRLRQGQTFGIIGLAFMLLIILPLSTVFAVTNIAQHRTLAKSTTWTWKKYYSFIDCIDRQLVLLSQDLKRPNLDVWAPTFPDITVELSTRHPSWTFTRTNDFYERASRAHAHGHDVDAVVVAETVNPYEREIDGPMTAYPSVRSLWMNWKEHYLNRLEVDPTFKPHRRHICQQGRWTAFMYMRGQEAP